MTDRHRARPGAGPGAATAGRPAPDRGEDGAVPPLVPPDGEAQERTRAPRRGFADLIAGAAPDVAPGRPAAAAAAVESLRGSARTRASVAVPQLPLPNRPGDAP